MSKFTNQTHNDIYHWVTQESVNSSNGLKTVRILLEILHWTEFFKLLIHLLKVKVAYNGASSSLGVNF